MHISVALEKPKVASLDSLYALIGRDLKDVDTLILRRVKSEVSLIEDVAKHIIASGGKRIRPALTLICAQLCKGNPDRAVPLAASIEFIHTATLLHDDVVDGSKLRRGLPTANEAFGNKASVLVGDFMLSQAFQLAVADGNPRVLGILADASAIIAKGEVLQLMNDRNVETTVDDYLRVVSSKTAALFAAACEMGGVAGGDPASAKKLAEFGMQIGIAFQLTDDVLDYSADQKTLGKAVGDDFREGKITLPIILAYQAGTRPEKAFLERTLGELEQRPDDFKKVCKLLAKYDAYEQSLAMAAGYCEKARNCLHGFGLSAARNAMLDAVNFALSRAY
jgi:octaprenyl-diphosphate synthase